MSATHKKKSDAFEHALECVGSMDSSDEAPEVLDPFAPDPEEDKVVLFRHRLRTWADNTNVGEQMAVLRALFDTAMELSIESFGFEAAVNSVQVMLDNAKAHHRKHMN